MNAAWYISSKTKKPHLYLDGSDTGVCGRGQLGSNVPKIKIPDSIPNEKRCVFCLRFEKRMKEYGQNIVYE